MTRLLGCMAVAGALLAQPRVLIIGDSISAGYAPGVKRLLEGKAEVIRIPENGGPTSRGLERIEQWLGAGKWDVIHFNWGLHDLKYMEDGKKQVGLEDYERNLRTLVRRLKQTGAKLIWASTTPVPEGEVSPPRKPEEVVEYNAAARRVMAAEEIGINDLYSFALPRLRELQRPVNVHFTEAGSEALAREVAAAIGRALERAPRR